MDHESEPGARVGIESPARTLESDGLVTKRSLAATAPPGQRERRGSRDQGQ
ncbi:hypothetical protein ACFQ56_17665 [Streptomyces niveus]|uniref:hypothetical protein n=1 Tax=Streptomyces niveus TaxID=193462 RepID=UPI0036AF5F00